MSKLMSLNSVRNRVHRSGFDMSYRNLFTAKAGELLPCFQQRVLPGDKGEIEFKGFVRTLPVNTAAFTRCRQYVDFFFVPYRLLWDKWNQFAVDTRDKFFAQTPSTAAGSFSSAPYVTDVDIQNLMGSLISNAYSESSPIPTATGLDVGGQARCVQSYKLIDLLGYGSILRFAGNTAGSNPSWNGQANPFTLQKSTTPTALDIFPFAAYQKIYMDYYRNSQWEVATPWSYNFDYIFNENQLHYDVSNISLTTTAQYQSNPFVLRYANWKKDYFMGMLPNSQYGDVAVAGPVVGNQVFSVRGSSLSPNRFLALDAAGLSSDAPANITSVSSGGSGSGYNPYGYLSNVSSSVNTSGISVLQIRIAEALQKYKEIKESGSQDYRDQIIRHWGVTPSYDQSNLCRHIGGFSSDIDISEVINTNITDNAEADLAGKGVGTQYGKLKYSFDEFGIILGIYHVEPLMDYTSDIGIDRKNLAITQDNLPIPEFDSIGMQETYLGELFYGNVSGGVGPSVQNPQFSTVPIGYAPRYAQWKTAIDKVHGGFTYGGFNNWVAPMTRFYIQKLLLSRNTTSPQYNNYTLFKIRPDILNPLFVAQVDGRLDFSFSNDQFQCSIYYKHHKKSNLSFDGMPY